MARRIVWVVITVLAMENSMAAVGHSRICKWKDDKQAAFSIVFDDGCHTQLDVAIPEMQNRGLVCATFWINPGGVYFTGRVAEWVGIVDLGYDFANHTMNHTGAPDYAGCDYEIGEAAKRIRSWNKSQLMLFHQGGGSVWGITDAQKTELLQKHGIYPHWDQPGRGLGTREGGNTNRSSGELRGFVDSTLASGDWHWTLFHGIGGDWVIQDRQPFLDMLDYMKTREDVMWFTTSTQAHKYKMERMHSVLSVLSTSANLIELGLVFDPVGLDQVDAAILDTLNYDYPLSLVTEVPTGWDSCMVTQSGITKAWPVESGEVMYEAYPGKGTISLQENTGSTQVRTGHGEQLTIHSGRPLTEVRQISGETTISAISPMSHSVRLYDLSGTQVALFQGIGPASYRLGNAAVSAGSYVAEVTSGGHVARVPFTSRNGR